jgi:hypothetical protein
MRGGGRSGGGADVQVKRGGDRADRGDRGGSRADRGGDRNVRVDRDVNVRVNRDRRGGDRDVNVRVDRDRTVRVDRDRRGGRVDYRRGRRLVWGGPVFYFYDGYYYGDCAWLRRRAVVTGSRIWWQRYRLCRAGYY